MWHYRDARGVPRRGEFVQHSERQGSDVTYFFKNESGATDVVSGARLQAAHRETVVRDDCPLCQQGS